MGMPDRKYSIANPTYRYGFNGKENDDDIESGIQDYGMRMYDTRLGKFLSVDPLGQEYPDYSSYQFASNSPISNIDRDGGEEEDASDALKDINEETEREKYENLRPSEDNDAPPPRSPQGRVVTKPGPSGIVRRYIEINFNSEEALDNLKDILGAPKVDIFNLPKESPKTPGDQALEDLSKSGNPTDRENAARMKGLPKLTVPKKEKVEQTKSTTTDTKVKHKNSNGAEGNIILYDIHADGANQGEHLKIGKADADNIMPSTGQPRRLRASELAARKHGYPNATASPRKVLGKTTTKNATDIEANEVKNERANGKKLPLNKERGKKYKQ